eukprot:CAMPEP_0201479978 /NCGR_PEP_ID=MMETSP0151_2-20130828/4586_1 /ASSEMBLY_ACC=CAM_ASM_000257 /TAXON_ID=200890 /ORGANISM="Paramoeba atlantica, Strain 621/1 / CCAP 1560/9" /LENGTH=667 /DNA_ID=CAMNT_0047861709 /DNA_START=57 /DNA_END=2060 /DNA_ORIENTATION=-
MKPFHWGKVVIKPNSKDMIWDGKATEIDFDTDLLEEMFAVKKTAKMKRKGGGVGGRGPGGARGEPGSENAILRVLAPKRSNAIGIMSSRMPSIDKILSAVRKMDSSVLTMEDVSALLNNFPTDEEIMSIKELSVADGRLDAPEQFCYKLCSLPDMKDRLRCWKFQMNFDEFVEDIQIPLFGIEEACKQLQKSKKLKKIFTFYLELGNYINGASSRGQADGFEITTLDKLSSTKDVTNTITLLEHGINQLKKRSPEILTFADELTRIPKASQISFTVTAENLRKLILEMKEVRTDILRLKEAAEAGSKSPAADDPFLKEMPKFADRATQKVLQVRDLLADVEAMFRSTLEYFHVKPDSSITTEEFFGIFNSFIESFKKIASKRPPKKKTGINTKGKKIGGNSKDEDPMANVINAIVSGKMDNAKDALTPKADAGALRKRPPGASNFGEKKAGGSELSKFKFRNSKKVDSQSGEEASGGGVGGSPALLSQVKLRSTSKTMDKDPPPKKEEEKTPPGEGGDSSGKNPFKVQLRKTTFAPAEKEEEKGGESKSEFKVALNRRRSLGEAENPHFGKVSGPPSQRMSLNFGKTKISGTPKGDTNSPELKKARLPAPLSERVSGEIKKKPSPSFGAKPSAKSSLEQSSGSSPPPPSMDCPQNLPPGDEFDISFN